jgi:hypothetical protein
VSGGNSSQTPVEHRPDGTTVLLIDYKNQVLHHRHDRLFDGQ